MKVCLSAMEGTGIRKILIRPEKIEGNDLPAGFCGLG